MSVSAAHILQVDHLTMRFGGLIAINDLSFTAQRSQITAHHRPERRRQDDGIQLHHRVL